MVAFAYITAARMEKTAGRRIAPNLPVKVSEWTSEDVGEWLAIIGARRYQDRFLRAMITGEVLLTMVETDLVRRVGVDDPISRRRLFIAIEALRPPPPPPIAPVGQRRASMQPSMILDSTPLATEPAPQTERRSSVGISKPVLPPVVVNTAPDLSNMFEQNDGAPLPPFLSLTPHRARSNRLLQSRVGSQQALTIDAAQRKQVAAMTSPRSPGQAVPTNSNAESGPKLAASGKLRATVRGLTAAARLARGLESGSSDDDSQPEAITPALGGSLTQVLQGDISNDMAVKIWIAQLSSAVDGIKQIRERCIRFDKECKRRQEDYELHGGDNDGGLTQFAKILEQERKKRGERRDHWYEVIGKKESKAPNDIAEQVKLDTRLKLLRRNSRIIPDEGADDQYETDIDGEMDDNFGQNDDQADQETIKKPWVILPTNPWRLKWDIAIMLLVVYYGIMTPIVLAFGDQVDSFELDMFFNALFGIDIILNFITAFRIEKGPDRGSLEVNVKVIAKTYMERWFWIDLVATVPLDLVMSSLGLTVNASFNKLARLLRGFKLIRVLKMSRVFKRLSQVNQTNPGILRLVKYFSMLLIMWHGVGCIYWIISDSEGYGATLWEVHPIFKNASFSTQYSQAIFWAVTVTTGVGRDVDPRTTITRLFTITAVVVGVLMYAFIVGSVSTALGNIGSADTEKRAYLETMRQYLSQREIDSKLQKRILDYYDYSFRQGLAKTNLMQDLHSSLKIKLDLVLNKKILSSVPVFQEISERCMMSIIALLESKIYLPQEYICLKGERALEMIFVVRGRIEILIPNRSKDNRMFLRDGDFCGERCLMENIRRETSIQAITHCEVLVLHKSLIKRLIRQYPDFAVSIQKYALMRSQIRGWTKIRSIVNIVRMLHLIGSHATFQSMFMKINNASMKNINTKDEIVEAMQRAAEAAMEKKKRHEAMMKRMAKRMIRLHRERMEKARREWEAAEHSDSYGHEIAIVATVPGFRKLQSDI